MKPKPLAATLSVVALVACLCWPRSATQPPVPKSAVHAAPATAARAVPVESIDLALGIEQKSIVAEFSGNGREEMRVIVMNKGTAPLRVTVPLGQAFECDTAAPVVIVRPGDVEVAPGKTREMVLASAATRSTNQPARSSWRLSYHSLPQLEPMLVKLQEHPELNIRVIQTAVLALTENLPLSAVAKFSPAASPLPSRFNTDCFRVETPEILNALILLREVKVKESILTLTIDPQLKIEAMIDPSARPLAMSYYGIASEREWEFWRNELLNGEPSTRHYALYGIARFYPDVALQMLPRWARETRTNPVYRVAAVQALADTERGEALPMLRSLCHEFGDNTELGRAASGAADYLDYQLAQNLAARNAVAFRNSAKNSFRGGAPTLVVAKN